MGVIRLNNQTLAPSTGGFYITNLVRPLPTLDASFISGANDGEMLENAALRNPLIEFDIWMTGVTAAQRRQQIHDISKQLAVKSPTSLKFSDDSEDNRYYKVVRQGDIVPQEYVDSAVIHVCFKSIYPWMLGDYQYFDIGESFTPKGNWPGLIELRASGSITPDSDKLFAFGGLTFVFDDTNSRTITDFNNEKRIAMFAGRYYAPTTNSTWPTVTPGTPKTISITKGSGSFKLRYEPRWI